MKIALAQINPCIGDLEGNVEICLSAVEQAHAQGADLVVLPEMAIPGYPPRDILFDNSFSAAVFEATADLAHCTADGPPVIVGTLAKSATHPPQHPGLYNAAMLLQGGKAHLAAAKRLLPAYDVFHEPRWFVPGEPMPPLNIDGKNIGVLICEDLWDEGYAQHPPADLLRAGADLLVAISASPYSQGIAEQRLYHARRQGCPLLYANLCGANDELIFDGRSFALNGKGEVVAQLPGFKSALQLVDLDGATAQTPPVHPVEEDLYQALVLGVRDFAQKNHLRHAYLGLSGGVDSALVAVIAAAALGSKNVTAVAIPSRYSDPRSTSSARDLAAALGTHFEVVELEPLHAATEVTLKDNLAAGGITAENVQARLRAMILMSFVNRHGGILLNTSNKTELALGYGTLYGDLAGTLCPIGDLTKPQVYAIARWIQKERGLIPRFILERPPSAELKPDQVDPFDYDRISPQIESMVRSNSSYGALKRSEHKRWHMGVVLRVSPKAFGSGRLIPITHK